MDKEQKFGHVTLGNRQILALLAGMLRSSLRMAYRQSGCAMTCVGVVDAYAAPQSDSDGLIAISGRREDTNEAERPVCVQLVGKVPSPMGKSLQVLQASTPCVLRMREYMNKLIYGTASLNRKAQKR